MLGSVLVSSAFSSFEFKEFSIVLVRLLYISVWFIIIADTGLNNINESTNDITIESNLTITPVNPLFTPKNIQTANIKITIISAIIFILSSYKFTISILSV